MPEAILKMETRSSLLQRLHDSCDETSWGEFVALYEPLLFRYVRSRGLSEEDVQDVVQSVFITLLQSLRQFELDRRRGRFRTWLWRVTQNAIADWARKLRRQKAAEEQWRKKMELVVKKETEEPDEEWEAACRHRLMEYALICVRNETQPQTWSCFEQHILRKRPGSEVGDELGISLSAVYVNASRVLQRVRRRHADIVAEEWKDD